VVIEHVFVTTLPSHEAMQRAAQFLQSGGFTNAQSAAFPLGGEWNSLEMRRGKTNAGRAKSVSQLPQLARLDWDRGRVTVALSIAANAVWGGGGFAVTGASGTPGNPKKMKLHADLLTAIARGLEQVLANQQPPGLARAEWDIAEHAISLAARKRSRRTWILVGVIFAALAAVIVLIVANTR
jgi:hypothetical protein